MFKDQHDEAFAPDSNSSARKAGTLSRQLYAGFLIFGLCFSVAVFLGVSSFVNSMLNSNYRYISQEAVDMVAQETGELEFSLRTLSTLIALSGEDKSNNVANKLRNVGQSLAHFEDVLWLYQGDSGGWVLSPLYRANNGSDYGVSYENIIKQEAVRRAVSDVVHDQEDLRLILTLYDDQGNVLYAPNGARLIGVAKSVKSDMVQDADAGHSVIFAVTHFGHIFMRNTKKLDRLISRISVRDIQTQDSLYEFKRHNTEISEEYDKIQIYSLEFGGLNFDIINRFYKQADMQFILVLPYLVFFCSLIVTLTGTFVLRNTQKQSQRIGEVNEKLSSQNRDLEDAIARRETLNAVIDQAEKDNRAIIDAVSDIIFETDESGKIVFLNKRWFKVTGFEVEQTIGRDLSALVHSQDKETVKESLVQLLVSGQGFRHFSQVRCADGGFRAVEISVSVMREDDAQNRRVVGTITDVEERRRAERALAQAEKKYRSIVENAAGGIFQLTPEGVYLSVNPAMAEILGYQAPEAILRDVKNAHMDVYADAKGRVGFMRHLDQMDFIRNHEVEVIQHDGTRIWVNENIRCVRDEAGTVLYYEGSLENISERKEAAILLQEAKVSSDMANRAKSEFLANMSHELRTPLNSIIGFSELIKNEVFGTIEERSYWEYARDIFDSGQHLLTVINEILDISKIEAGERQLNESVVDVSKVAQGCLELLNAKITENDIVVTNALSGSDADVPQIVAEELAVKQVFMNLLSNAVKFTPKGGRVTLSYEVDREGGLNVSFTDTGVGLDQDEIKKALSPFGQVNSDLNRSGSGTGLGLTLVDALLKLHGGALDLFSQKGIGTTATAVFPAARLVGKPDSVASFHAVSEGAE